MTQKITSHARARGRAVSPDTLEIQFTSEGLKSLQHLAAAVHGRPEFDYEMASNLNNMANGQPREIGGAISDLMTISVMAQKVIDTTNDQNVVEALNGLHRSLAEGKPFTLVKAETQQTR